MVSVNCDGGWHGNKLPTKLDLPLVFDSRLEAWLKCIFSPRGKGLMYIASG